MTAQESREKDVLCTRCHDESEPTPILSLYQTKHGVRGDARTPNCQTCHGESQKHLKGDPNVKGRAAPDIIYKKGVFEVTDNKVRAGQCLNCHKGTKRSNWDGGQHDNNQMACNDCHKVHTPADKVLSKKTQTEVCFTCHKEQRADSHKTFNAPDRCRQGRLLGLPQSARCGGTQAAQEGHGDRDLLHLPCGETRPIPV